MSPKIDEIKNLLKHLNLKLTKFLFFALLLLLLRSMVKVCAFYCSVENTVKVK